MALSSKQIIALGQVQGYGAKTVHNLAMLSKGEKINTARELMDFVNGSIRSKKVQRARPVEQQEIEAAIKKAEQIITQSESLGIRITSFLDDDFPKNLLKTIDENGKPAIPTILYYKGDLKATERKGIAIIGTREPTSNGLTAAKYLGRVFAERGYNIVSGLAMGCDTGGHTGALEAGGVTTAFLAHGLDMIYPETNRKLAEEIVRNGGLLMSEYPVGVKVNRYNLVERDRLQAGLADATIVIQTGVKGGTLHAANTTLQAKKPLFCVKFNTPEPESKIGGNALLVEKGARYLDGKEPVKMVEEGL
ncbi:MAG: DNA-protecting protein DprA [Fibrobacter sp.]|nr:DNA-protecting protein DprA [Fibrobacter sp.]